MAERNVHAPKARRKLYRIDVNLGDIVHDGALSAQSDKRGAFTVL
jgi:hypothetical protein